MNTGAGDPSEINLHDLPIETLRRQLSHAYLALEALDEDRRRIIAERDTLKRALEKRSPKYVLEVLKHIFSKLRR